MVPTILSDADASHLVGMCAACRRDEGDPLRVLQLGVSIYPLELLTTIQFSHDGRDASQLQQ